MKNNNINQSTIYPKFNIKYHASYALGIYLILALFFIIEMTNWWNIIAWDSKYFFACSAFIISMLWLFYYPFTTFLLNHDKVSYINSFINYRRKDIKFDEIQEVILKMGFIQKRFGLGDIEFITNASSPYAHGINKAGLTFFNIENPQEVYDLVQQRIAEHKKK